MNGGGWTSRFNFRKHIEGSNAKQSKYRSIVKTRDELDAEEQDKAVAGLDKLGFAGESESESDDDQEMVASRSKKTK